MQALGKMDMKSELRLETTSDDGAGKVEAAGEVDISTVTDFRKAIESKPDCFEAWANFASGLARQQKFQESIECYDKALEIIPKDAQTWFHKGMTQRSFEKFEDAIKTFDTVLKLDKTMHEAYFYIAIAFKNLGKEKESEKAMKTFEEKENEMAGLRDVIRVRFRTDWS